MSHISKYDSHCTVKGKSGIILAEKAYGVILTKTESLEMSSVTGLTSNLLECTPSAMNSSKWTQMRIQICKSKKQTQDVQVISHIIYK